MNLDISVIIVTFNSENDIYNCLKSVYDQTKDLTFEIIIVDNASSDNTNHIVEKHFPEVKLIINNSNIGYSKSNNKAVSVSNGEYLFFLNPDCILLNNCIEELLVEYKIEPRTGIIGPKLLNTDGSLQLSAGFIPKLSTTIFELWRLDIFLPKNLFGYRYVPNNTVIKKEVGWVTGACFLIKKSLFEAINGFDENFFMYLEDVDLCQRINNMKKKIFFTTNTSVIHHKAQSSKQNRFVAKQASYQSKIYFYEKNNGLSKKYILKLFIIISAYLELLYLIILYHSSDRVDRIFMQRKVIKCTV